MVMKNYKYHYTYLITNLNPTTEEKYYIGVHSCDCLPEDDINYMGSSYYLGEAIKNEGIEIFEKIIIREFNSRDKAEIHENLLHIEHEVVTNILFYNKKTGTVGWHTTDESIQKYKRTVNSSSWKETTGKERSKNQKETKSNIKWKETKGIESVQKMLNTVNSKEWKETKGVRAAKKRSQTVNDPIWKETTGKESLIKRKKTVDKRTQDEQNIINKKISNTVNELEWKETKGRERSRKQKEKYHDLNWMNSTGKERCRKLKETINNPIWKETTGKIQQQKHKETVNDLNWIKTNTFVCLHCGKSIIGRGNFNRWHNDNCKKKN